jgi:exodeoxyribonuclease VII large subunit
LPPIFTVSQVTSYVRALIEGDQIMQSVLVQGELSNCRLHSSGHFYFTLKDKTSCLRAVMFRSRAQALRFRPSDGLQVLAQGSLTVYERDGQYQMIVNSLQPAGVGSLYLALEQLKERLQAEGLFDEGRKRPLPPYPQTIGIATSPTGAAIRDLLSIIKRRYPKVSVYLYPIAVQGATAPASIVAGLHALGQLPEVDLIIVGRGGGSREELWAFNDEAVARAIAACPKPVVSAVGHESDFTIADLVADRRAATPSAAAELAVPVLWELERQLNIDQRRLLFAQQSLLARKRRELAALAERRVLHSPQDLLRPLHQALDDLEYRLTQAISAGQQQRRAELQQAAGRLQAMSPLAVLARGYSITLSEQGEAIISPVQVAAGDRLVTVLAHGKIQSQVLGVGS